MATTDFTKLQPRQKKYLEGRTQGMTKREAKRYAQYAESTSPARIENQSVRAAFARLIKQAVPAHLLTKRIAEGVSAHETKFFQKEGVVTDQRDVVAWSERREYLKLAAEYGQYVEPDAKAGDVNVAVGFTLINGITKPRGRSQIKDDPYATGVGAETHVPPEPDRVLNPRSSFALINGITGGKTNAG
ncbi:MAG: hypothetical protein WCC37_21865 [Candidatus Sulfotelmatobacter sp.]|jgi:hypothetical protein